MSSEKTKTRKGDNESVESVASNVSDGTNPERLSQYRGELAELASAADRLAQLTESRKEVMLAAERLWHGGHF
jgi:hypothetical protein